MNNAERVLLPQALSPVVHESFLPCEVFKERHSPLTTYRQTFISHAHVDNHLCDRYAEALRARDVPIYYDRTNPRVGRKVGELLEHELILARALVLLATPAALTSFWVGEEIEMYFNLMAKDPSRLMFVVRIEDCDLPPRLAIRLGVDALSISFEQAVYSIAQAIAVDGDVDQRTLPTLPVLPPLGPAPAPAEATPAHYLTLMSLNRLGFRGYVRQGVECILPPICPVPGGRFTMGTDKSKDSQAYDDELPKLPIEVNPFTIGVHPVTVAEYNCAVRAKAVRVPRDADGVTWQYQLTRPDHPVVCVTWHDAEAYARWLCKTTGNQKWRLPTEAEWEKAARWDYQRQVSHIYPWGDSFDQTRCNTWESEIKMATPIGSYPTGVSPYGAQDMAGNVWEWTSSLYKPCPYITSNGREYIDSTENRSLRGGSWNNYARDARTAYRYNLKPSNFQLSWQ